ncbi:MAG: methionyl-tRNA formyltransferase [Planctomycetota bacterium]|nr:methionyl-tRNA formyltransferase [Planctomycetota bacterium]
MMGTGPFAVPTFEALVTSRHNICGLVTRPLAGVHRKKRIDINPMRESAERFGLQIHDPYDVNAPEFSNVLEDSAAELFVVCDYGQILSRRVLSLAPLGGINLHGSLLPRYRGAAPIQWSIYNGDTVTGNTVIHMTSKLDGGPILKTVELDIDPEDNAVSVETKLSQLGPKIVLQCLEMLEQWDRVSETGLPQNPDHASKAPRLSKSDGQIDWHRSALAITNQVRAFQPWPGSYCDLVRQRNGKPSTTRLILNKVRCYQPNFIGDGSPGEITVVDDQEIVVQTGQGQLTILELQPAGKKNMACVDFLRGNPLTPGDQFLQNDSR